MRKERNTFFQESSYNQGYYNNYQPMMPQAPQIESQSSFYMNDNPNMENYNSRISKIERQINRIEARLNKLENTNNIVNNTESIDNKTDMYMI